MSGYRKILDHSIPSIMATPSTSIQKCSEGRKSLLVYLDDAFIKRLKKAAVDEDFYANEIVEHATPDWLMRRAGAGG